MNIRRLRFATLLALLPLLAACDSADGGGGDNTFELDPQSVFFEFDFTGAEIAAAEITSNGTEDLTDYVRSRGFQPEDIVGVRIVSNSAELFVTRPPGAGVEIFESAQVRLAQGTSLTGVVVRNDDLPSSGDRADLTVASDDFANLVRNGEFSAQLAAAPSSTIDPDASYEVEVEFDVLIEVEG